MPRIRPLPAVSKEAEKILREIEVAFGMVPNLFKTYAHHPALLEANWNKVKAVMMQGSLSGKVKQTIAVLVSKDNACKYCVAAHRGALKSIGVSDADFEALKKVGASDAEIIEALGVMEIFTSFNKFLDSLRVDVDF